MINRVSFLVIAKIDTHCGDNQRIVIGTVDRLWEIVGSQLTVRPLLSQQLSPFVEAVCVTATSALVATIDSLLLVGTSVRVLKEFGGGTTSPDGGTHVILTLPFKSHIPYDLPSSQNKKQRLQCKICVADALFVDKKGGNNLFCSHYCLYKSLCESVK